MIPTRNSLLPARKYARRQRREIVGEGEEILNKGVFSRKYLQGRSQVRAGMVTSTCGKGCMCVCGGCSALQGRMQCTARTDAVHCRSGCSALRLRRAKGTAKSPVLFWMRDKGGETHPIRVSVAPQIYLVIRFLLERFIPHCLEGTPL